MLAPAASLELEDGFLTNSARKQRELGTYKLLLQTSLTC